MKKFLLLMAVILMWSCGSSPGQISETAESNPEIESSAETETPAPKDVSEFTGAESDPAENESAGGSDSSENGSSAVSQKALSFGELFGMEKVFDSKPVTLPEWIESAAGDQIISRFQETIEYISPGNDLMFFSVNSGARAEVFPAVSPEFFPERDLSPEGSVYSGSPYKYLSVNGYSLFPVIESGGDSLILRFIYPDDESGFVASGKLKIPLTATPELSPGYGSSFMQNLDPEFFVTLGKGDDRIILQMNTAGQLLKTWPKGEYQYPVYNPYLHAVIYIENGSSSDYVLPDAGSSPGRLMLSNGITPPVELLPDVLSFKTSDDYRYMLVWERKRSGQAALIFADVENERWIEIVSGAENDFQFGHSWGFAGSSANFYYLKNGTLHINNIDAGISPRSIFVKEDFTFILGSDRKISYEKTRSVTGGNKVPMLEGPEQVEKMFVDFHRIQRLKKMIELVPKKVLDKYSRSIPFNFASNEVKALELIASIAKKYYSRAEWKSFTDNYRISSTNDKTLVENQLKKIKNIF